MAAHNQLGLRGEQMAEEYFLCKGYKILHRNWRHRHLEIDLIAMKGNLLHFIEVKIRSSQKHGLPEESVTRKKMQFLLKAADAFLYLNPKYKLIQFDILAITLNDNCPEYFLIEDVYI
jgi:putative endonuclease